MNDEIKEILDYLGNDNIEKPFGMATIDKHKLLDHITNLQQELAKEKEEKDSWQTLATKFFSNREDYKARIDKAVEYLNGRSDE